MALVEFSMVGIMDFLVRIAAERRNNRSLLVLLTDAPWWLSSLSFMILASREHSTGEEQSKLDERTFVTARPICWQNN